MPRPIEDKQVLYGRSLVYEGKEWEAYLTAWATYPTFREDCKIKREIKEDLRVNYMKALLKNG